MKQDPRAIGAQIRMRLPQLTPLERRVVEAIIARTDITEQTSLKEIAQENNVSEAMVVKIAKKLNFSGFRNFRSGLIYYNQSEVASLHAEIEPGDSSEQLLSKVFRTSIQAIEETMSILDIAEFDRAADIIFKARHIDLYAVGGSATVARDLSHKLLKIGIKSTVYDDAHIMLMSASVLSDDDAVLAISHSGATRAVNDPVKLAARNGAKVIAITNYAESPIARNAHVVLNSTSQGSHLLGGKRRVTHCPTEYSGCIVCGHCQERSEAGGEEFDENPACGSGSAGILTMSKIVVAGSLHYDIMLDAHHRPEKGETVMGSGCTYKFGGKGGNQAISAARAGAAVAFIGAVGADAQGQFLLQTLRDAGVDTGSVVEISGIPSGMSVAISDADGDYGAVVVSNANQCIPAGLFQQKSVWQDAGMLVLQNEVPETINLCAAMEAKKRDIPVCINAAPARELSSELENCISLLVVNGVEARDMSGITVSDLSSALRAAELLARRFPGWLSPRANMVWRFVKQIKPGELYRPRRSNW